MADALGILGTVADLAGLATKIGTSVPGLKKARKRNTSARAARQGGLSTAAAAVGGAQSGFGASRGLALRTGLRGAEQAARGAADAASTAAAHDEARYVSERDKRNERLATFGKDAAGFAGQVGQGIVDVKAANEAAKAAEQATALPDQAEVAGVDPVTGLSIEQNVEPQAAALGLPPMPEMQLEPELDAGMGGSQDPNLGNVAQQLQAPPTTAMQAYQSALGINPSPALQLAPIMEYKLRVTNLAVEEAERMGVEPASVIAPILRKLNIDPMQLQGSGYEGEHAEMESL